MTTSLLIIIDDKILAQQHFNSDHESIKECAAFTKKNLKVVAMLDRTIFALFLLIALSAVLVQCEKNATVSFLPLKKAGHCNVEKCQLPNCRCSGLRLPSADFKEHVKEIPQVIAGENT